MSKPLRGNLLREIKSTLNRFIAILAIAALGTGFYAGLKATGPDMAETADRYYDAQRLSDYRLLSTLGFTEDDVAALRARGDLSAVMPGYSIDLLMEAPGGTEPVRLMALPQNTGAENTDYLNQPVVLEGRLPQAADECLADSAAGYHLGDIVALSAENEEDALDRMTVDRFTVVGLAQSPAYISFQRGNTSIGGGTLHSFYYLSPQAFDPEVYTEILLRDSRAEGLSSFGEDYDAIIEEGTDTLEAFGEERAEVRYDELRTEGEETLTDARTEWDKGRRELNDAKEDADRALDDAQNQLDEGRQALEKGRRDAEDGRRKLDEGRQELEKGQRTLDKGRATLEEKRRELEQGQAEYDKGKKSYDKGLSQYKAQKKTYDKGLRQYEDGLAQYNAGLAQYESGLAEYQQKQAQYDAARAALSGLYAPVGGLEQLAADAAAALTAGDTGAAAALLGSAPASLRGLAGGMAGTGLPPAATDGLYAAATAIEGLLAASEYTTALGTLQGANAGARGAVDAALAQLDQNLPALQQAKAELDTAKAALDATKATLDASKTELDAAAAQLDAAKKELDDAKKQLDDSAALLAQGRAALAQGEEELTQGQQTLEAARREVEQGERDLITARQKLADAQGELDQGEADYLDAKITAEEEIAKGEKELDDALFDIEEGQRQLDDLEKPDWYVLDRGAGPGYTGFEFDTRRIDSIALVFPVFFFLVATLVCLTTMTRMVEDQRTQIGTLKALGYSPGQIAFKYLFYAAFASLAGAVIGVLVGSWVFPTAIWEAYSIMYVMPSLVTPLHPAHTAVSILAAVLCTTLAAFGACWGEMRSVPATLMRPKAPRPGKRVLLERFGPLWRRLSFNQKVTVRNLFRYKRRFFMTVIGVAGCSALMLTGFGLRDSIDGLVELQYGQFSHYDVVASLSGTGSAHDDSELNELLPALGESLYLQQDRIDASRGGADNANMTTYLYVPQQAEALPRFLTLRDRHTQETVAFPPPQGSAVITEKLAETLGAAPGDIITINQVDGPRVEVTVAGICENYVMNYVYMTPETYEGLFDEAPGYNSVLLALAEEGPAADEALRQVVDTEGVAGAMSISALREQLDDMLGGVDSVIWVILLAAAALSFVVLYNLTNINITERSREIATLKVLGFYPREVSSYIYRENLILTSIGAVGGLALGVVLHRFIITTLEVDEVMFQQQVMPLSFVWAVVFTVVTGFLVNLVMLRRLHKIDMVESLKSAE